MPKETTVNEFWPSPPKSFNPEFNPDARGAWGVASKEMEAEGFYDTHSRDECAVEIKKRAEAILKERGL